VDDAVLLVSELLTNALKASEALRVPTPIVLRLLANDQQLIIEAWDGWVEGFDLQRRSTDDEHGPGAAGRCCTQQAVGRPAHQRGVQGCVV
jgi:anti-sigma regulatory factor (Ser/Thr protein kinase)